VCARAGSGFFAISQEGAMRHWSVTRTLIVAFVCLGALPAAFLGWRLIATTHAMSGALSDAQSRELGRSLHTVALSLTDRIDRTLVERYDDAQACGVNTALLYHRAWYRVGSSRNRIVRAANRYVKLYGVYTLAMMVDLSGRVVAVNDRDANGKTIETAWLYDKPFAGASWFEDAKAGRFLTGSTTSSNSSGGHSTSSSDNTHGSVLAGAAPVSGSVVQDVYVDEDVKKICGGDGLTLGFSAPVFDAKGRVIGVWNNRASFALVDAVVAAAARDLAAQGLDDAKLTLVDRQGRILSDYDPARATGDALLRDMQVRLTTNLAERGFEAARRVRTGESGESRERDPRRGVWQTTGYAASRGVRGFPGLGWGVLARVDDRDSDATSGADAAESATPTTTASNSTSSMNSAGMAARGARTEVLGVLATSLLLLGLAAWWLGRSITRPVLGGIARLKQNASQVSAVSMELAESSQSISIGAGDQAAAIEASSASMEEMSSMTRQNATHAEEAASLMTNARELVDGANVALGGMVESMGAIQQATTGISKIIKTIDALAFQSNLLALNAAIEAARAGAAGAGFGVVADEVRSLAQRSAQAAKDTSSLIEASIARAGEGTRRVDEVVQAMAAITARLERLHGLLQQVKGASGQQTQGIDQVTHALAQMGQATQANAAAAEESAATSQELTAVAHAALAVIASLERIINGATPPPSSPGPKARSLAASRPSRPAQATPKPRQPRDRARPSRAA
jgi:hypothetical protein